MHFKLTEAWKKWLGAWVSLPMWTENLVVYIGCQLYIFPDLSYQIQLQHKVKYVQDLNVLQEAPRCHCFFLWHLFCLHWNKCDWHRQKGSFVHQEVVLNIWWGLLMYFLQKIKLRVLICPVGDIHSCLKSLLLKKKKKKAAYAVIFTVFTFCHIRDETMISSSITFGKKHTMITSGKLITSIFVIYDYFILPAAWLQAAVSLTLARFLANPSTSLSLGLSLHIRAVP